MPRKPQRVLIVDSVEKTPLSIGPSETRVEAQVCPTLSNNCPTLGRPAYQFPRLDREFPRWARYLGGPWKFPVQPRLARLAYAPRGAIISPVIPGAIGLGSGYGPGVSESMSLASLASISSATPGFFLPPPPPNLYNMLRSRAATAIARTQARPVQGRLVLRGFASTPAFAEEVSPPSRQS